MPFLVISGDDDVSVQEYEELGYQIIIYAPTPVITAVAGLERAYTSLRETGLTGIREANITKWMAKVEELIDLPAYYRIEAETTEQER